MLIAWSQCTVQIFDEAGSLSLLNSLILFFLGKPG